MPLTKLLPLLAGVVLATQAAAQSAPPEIPLSGHIGAAQAQQIGAALGDGKPHVIRVNSSGGENQAGLALAQAISRAHAALIVDGVCAGPCANYLFPAAARRSVQPASLVIFSPGATAHIAMVPDRRRSELMSDYVPLAEQERKLFSGAGIDSALLLAPQLALKTQCYSLTSKDRSGKAYINYKAAFIGWTPSRTFLTGSGLKVSGFWPRDAEQFRATLKTAFPQGLRGEIAFGEPGLPARPQLLDALKHVPECDAGPSRPGKP